MKKSLLLIILFYSAALFTQAQIPDNIIETDCNQNIPSVFQEPQLLHSTGNQVHAYATPICGDIDGDGIVEIVIAHYAGNEARKHWTNQVGVYRGTDLSLISTVNIPEEIYMQYNPIGIVRYPLDNGTMQGAIVAVCCDDKIRSYSKDGTLLQVSDKDIPCDGTPSFADFNNDGYPEVYIGNAIYDAATLKLLCEGPSNGNKGLSHRGTLWSQQYPHRAYYAIPYASNIFGDENLELICGNTIYNVNIASRTNPSLNSVSINKTIIVPNGYPQDGHIALADLDLDGELEVLVNRDNTHDSQEDNCYLYAYKPSNGQILFKQTHYCRSIGFPAICNIDHDPYPEIIFCDYQYDVSEEKLYCWNYIPGTGLSAKWTYHHNDPSGMTSMTFFDFNNDEKPEVVYRDAYAFNIFNCTGKSHITGNDTIGCYTLFSYPMRSGTASEHPIIADVNGDGSAEIITNGFLDYSSDNNGYGSLLTFGHPEWPSARPVWNQYAYNVTNVNDDLTIPTLCFNNATAFTAPDGSIRRPFNNFLLQATYLDQYGEPYNPTGIVEIDVFGEGCSSYTYHETTYTESGIYEQFIENPNGCDTLATVHVSLVESFFHTFAATACDSYTWNGITYYESGVYKQDFTSQQGCDSIVQLSLTIKTTPFVGEIQGETHYYYTDYGDFDYFIEPVEGAFGYEWSLDNQDWTLNYSSQSPSCTVGIHNNGIGTLTVKVYSECGVIKRQLVIHHDEMPDVIIFPNPTKEDFKIRLLGMKGECVIQIFDVTGNLIDTLKTDAVITGTDVPYSLKYKACAMYLVCVINTHNTITRKVVKWGT